MHRACAALRNAAAELRTHQPDDIAQHPKQRHIGRDIDGMRLTIDLQGKHRCLRIDDKAKIARAEFDLTRNRSRNPAAPDGRRRFTGVTKSTTILTSIAPKTAHEKRSQQTDPRCGRPADK
jgi:hypothetical protein